MKILCSEGEEKKIQRRIGESERSFFRALVDVDGFYQKDEQVKITEIIENYGDLTVKAQKNGTVAIVSIKIHFAEGLQTDKYRKEAVYSDLEIEGEEALAEVSVSVISDFGSVQEIVQACLFEAKARLSVPSLSEVFGKKQSVSYDIFRHSKKERETERTATYAAIGNKFCTSPIHQERAAADAVVTITSCAEEIVQIEVEEGEILPSNLAELVKAHMKRFPPGERSK